MAQSLMEEVMSLAVYFHYSTPRGVVLNQSATEVGDLPELRELAIRFVQTLISAPNLDDWRNCILHVTDDMGAELFAMPFSTTLGLPH
jgi:uncharacterized protein DUF6894